MGLANFRLSLIPSSCRPRVWDANLTGRLIQSYSAPTIPWDGILRNMKKNMNSGRDCCILATNLSQSRQHLGNGRSAHGISKAKLEGNPYWPPELAQHAGKLSHERYVIIAPLALSRTQDDKGRVRWTLFGGSEQGPERAFWQSFFTAPGREIPEAEGVNFFRRLLNAAYDEPLDKLADLKKAGFRILPGIGDDNLPYEQECSIPSWMKPYLFSRREKIEQVKYLLTFHPFGCLPKPVKRAYLSGESESAAISGQPGVLGRVALSSIARRIADGSANPVIARFFALRRSSRHSRAAIGLVARTASRPSES